MHKIFNSMAIQLLLESSWIVDLFIKIYIILSDGKNTKCYLRKLKNTPKYKKTPKMKVIHGRVI